MTTDAVDPIGPNVAQGRFRLVFARVPKPTSAGKHCGHGRGRRVCADPVCTRPALPTSGVAGFVCEQYIIRTLCII